MSTKYDSKYWRNLERSYKRMADNTDIGALGGGVFRSVPLGLGYEAMMLGIHRAARYAEQKSKEKADVLTAEEARQKQAAETAKKEHAEQAKKDKEFKEHFDREFERHKQELKEGKYQDPGLPGPGKWDNAA